MLKSKLHNPIIASGSVIENVVIEKVDNQSELNIIDLNNTEPIVPENGRIWFNSETGSFRFSNISNGNTYVDEYLSKTDERTQQVVADTEFKNNLTIFDLDDSIHFKVDSVNSELEILNNSSIINTEIVELNSKTGEQFLEIDTTQSKISIWSSNLNINNQNTLLNNTSDLKITNGTVDKVVLDHVIDKMTLNYDSLTLNHSTADINLDLLRITNKSTDKIVIDNTNDELSINFANINTTGDIAVDGNMIVTGDLTVGGQTSRVDIQSENLEIADNIITLNSNLTDSDDPRLASAIVDGEDVDANAGIAVNRGSEGVMDWIKWVESTDTTTTETLKEAVSKVSIWNYEAATPSYELHQIIDAYTLGREVINNSGSSWIGFDGYIGSNFQKAINNGDTTTEAEKIGFKLDSNKLDNVIDLVAEEIDSIKFNTYNKVRFIETTTAGKKFTITHNLNTVFIDVRIQREDNSQWFFDILPIEVVDNNTIKIESTEDIKIRVMIMSINGFEIPSTDIEIA